MRLCRPRSGLVSGAYPSHGTLIRTVLRPSSTYLAPIRHQSKCRRPINVLSCRGIQQSTGQYNSQPPQNVVFPDPHRPDLFYHLLNPPNPLAQTLPAFGLSFIYSAPTSPDSTGIIGWLPAHISEHASDSEAHTEEDLEDSPEQAKNHTTLQDFRENPKFISFLHQVIQYGLTEGIDDFWKDTALQLQHGWMHIHDQRNPPSQGRTGDPEDIIGSVLVENSKIKAETYQPMPSYRVCTGDGVVQLTPGLSSYLKRSLQTEI